MAAHDSADVKHRFGDGKQKAANLKRHVQDTVDGGGGGGGGGGADCSDGDGLQNESDGGGGRRGGSTSEDEPDTTDTNSANFPPDEEFLKDEDVSNTANDNQFASNDWKDRSLLATGGYFLWRTGSADRYGRIDFLQSMLRLRRLTIQVVERDITNERTKTCRIPSFAGRNYLVAEIVFGFSDGQQIAVPVHTGYQVAVAKGKSAAYPRLHSEVALAHWLDEQQIQNICTRVRNGHGGSQRLNVSCVVIRMYSKYKCCDYCVILWMRHRETIASLVAKSFGIKSDTLPSAVQRILFRTQWQALIDW